MLFCQDFVSFHLVSQSVNYAILTKRVLKMTFCQCFVRILSGLQTFCGVACSQFLTNWQNKTNLFL